MLDNLIMTCLKFLKYGKACSQTVNIVCFFVWSKTLTDQPELQKVDSLISTYYRE